VQFKLKTALANIMKVYGGSRGCVPLLILKLGGSWRWVVNTKPRPLFSQDVYSGTRWAVIWLGLRAFYGEELLLLPGFEPWIVQPVAIL